MPGHSVRRSGGHGPPARNGQLAARGYDLDFVRHQPDADALGGAVHPPRRQRPCRARGQLVSQPGWLCEQCAARPESSHDYRGDGCAGAVAGPGSRETEDRMSGVSIYRTEVAPEWIDYNGHLRDAYYSLIVSLATDALMDRLGLDEAYRARTRCTLYTLEMHMHFLHEVKKTDVVDVAVRILGTDRKRIHAAFDMRCGRYPDPVATAEIMLLHVYQGDEPKAQAFPSEVVEALAGVAEEEAAAGALAADTAGAGTGAGG